MSDKNVIRCLFLLFLLNLIDICVTATLVPANIAKEINPLMDYVLNIGVFPFILVKLCTLFFVICVFWTHRHHILAKIGIFLSLFAYSSLILYFLVNIL